MEHRRVRQQYRLTFDKPEHMAGLEVLTRGPTRRQLFRIAALGSVDLDNLVGDGVDELDRLCNEFGDRLIDWNHTDEEGQPLPANQASLDEEDWEFVLPLVKAWMMTVMGTTPDAQVESQPPANSGSQFAGQTTIEEQLADLPMQ